jgi:4'-phosphopantetheinyl transferase
MILFYSKISEKFHENIIKKYLNDFDELFIKKTLSYRRWQDAQLSLLGRRLLLEGFKEYEISSNEINNLVYNKFGKPFLKNNPVFFNISHSGDFVICAINDKSEIGIDIEIISDIEINDFKSQLTENEWSNIILSNNKKATFFDYWTQKEAVVKAHGHGLTIPLNSFEILENETIINNEKFYLQEVKIDIKYKCYVSLKEYFSEVLIKQIQIN